MNVLIVEDVLYRQEFLKKVADFNAVDCTQYADKALELLKENSYDLVFLDHDLIGAKSGSYLTMNWHQYRNELKTSKPIVIIHSMNMEGAARMENHLKGISKATERVPFQLIVSGAVNVKALIQQLTER